MPTDHAAGRRFGASAPPLADKMASDPTAEVLLAVCDVLVMKSLEKLGNYLVRSNRSRYNELAQSGKPAYAAHALWPANDELVSKALKNAWDVVPYVIDVYGRTVTSTGQSAVIVLPADVIYVLDRYVHDLAITGHEHDLVELAYRMRTYLKLKVWAPKRPILSTRAASS
jgi:hypothetical protein